MIVTLNFNILLFPKCGTHYIASVFEKTKDKIYKETGCPVKIDTAHIPASKLPYMANRNPTGVVVRNVWDWYVSRYFYFENARLNGEAGFSSNQKGNDIQFIAKKWTKNCGFGKTINGFRKHLPYALENFPLGETYYEFIRDAHRIHFIRHEELALDLHNFISDCSMGNIHCYIDTLAAIAQQKPVNVTENRPTTADCYTAKQIEQVCNMESKYIARFGQGYSFNK